MTDRTPRKRHGWSVKLGQGYVRFGSGAYFSEIEGCGFCGLVRAAFGSGTVRYLNPQPDGTLWTRKPRPCFEVVG